MHSDFILDAFLERNLYSNEILKSLRAVSTAFTDVSFWQISRAYVVLNKVYPIMHCVNAYMFLLSIWCCIA